MIHEPDLSASRYGTIVCPRTQVTTPEVLPTRDPTPHDTYYVSSLQCTQRQCHDLMNISNQTAPGNQSRGPSGLCSILSRQPREICCGVHRDLHDGLYVRSLPPVQEILDVVW